MKRIAFTGIVLSALAIATAYGAAFTPGGAPAWSAWLLAIGTACCMIALCAFGAATREGRIGALAAPLAITLAILLVCFALALWLPGEHEPLLLGLPRRAAIVLYGIGIVPAFILPLSYALTFDTQTLTEADIARVREAGNAERERREAA
jgi:hypothetical protein